MAQNPPAPPAQNPPAPPAWKETNKLFLEGGGYFLFNLDQCKGFEKELAYLPAVFVDALGSEYEARISPLPVNKGDMVDVPALENQDAEFAKLRTMDPVSQVRELKRLQSILSSPAKAFVLNGELTRLTQYQGRWCKTILITDEVTKQSNRYPVCDLIVNFSRNTQRPEWKPIASVRPREFVPSAPPGSRQVPHFYTR